MQDFDERDASVLDEALEQGRSLANLRAHLSEPALALQAETFSQQARVARSRTNGLCRRATAHHAAPVDAPSRAVGSYVERAHRDDLVTDGKARAMLGLDRSASGCGAGGIGGAGAEGPGRAIFAAWLMSAPRGSGS